MALPTSLLTHTVGCPYLRQMVRMGRTYLPPCGCPPHIPHQTRRWSCLLLHRRSFQIQGLPWGLVHQSVHQGRPYYLRAWSSRTVQCSGVACWPYPENTTESEKLYNFSRFIRTSISYKGFNTEVERFIIRSNLQRTASHLRHGLDGIVVCGKLNVSFPRRPVLAVHDDVDVDWVEGSEELFERIKERYWIAFARKWL